MAKNDDFKFEIVKHFGVISTSRTGWAKELNMVSWNGAAAKYDIREWSPDHSTMGKGVTLTLEDFNELFSLMSEVVDNEGNDPDSIF